MLRGGVLPEDASPDAQVREVQVDPIKARVESAICFSALKLKYYEPLSRSAFKSKFRRYSSCSGTAPRVTSGARPPRCNLQPLRHLCPLHGGAVQVDNIKTEFKAREWARALRRRRCSYGDQTSRTSQPYPDN
jgi:hypothetical protein